MKFGKRVKVILVSLILIGFSITAANAQIIERERPKEWEGLVYGGRFMDRFLPIPVMGELTADTWGAENVLPRYTDNGIEDDEWSYWGGNARLGEDGKYHLFVCGWPEDSPKGHMQWRESIVFHAVAENSLGPYRVKDRVGAGHNPEVFQLQDGRYVVYVIDGYYIADDFEGPWEYSHFEFDPRDRKIIEGLSNLTFTRREDGSFLMVCRGGGVWFSRTGTSPYYQVTAERVYPPVEGRFEDPLIWRTNIQYHLIVNDWLGRTAFYLRSKDGINWKTEPGEAYMPGIAKYQDGTVVEWFKYERIKVLQDEYGRATQAHFAVIDTLKREDKASDNHSSKQICIPLTVGRLLTILNKEKITGYTDVIQVRVEAEDGFDPHADINLESLRFGASEEVNFGRGSRVKTVKKSGNDLIVFFEGRGNGLTEENFAAKLLGKTSKGELMFGYARLPGLDYLEPALSARLPRFKPSGNGYQVLVEVQNFGQVKSSPSKIRIVNKSPGEEALMAEGEIPVLEPFQKSEIELNCGPQFETATSRIVEVVIESEGLEPVSLKGSVSLD